MAVSVSRLSLTILKASGARPAADPSTARRSAAVSPRTGSTQTPRSFDAIYSRAVEPLVISPGVEIPAAALAWTAVRASGPGGQNVNKVATKVELRYDLAGDATLNGAVKARLRKAHRKQLADGALVVASQATRSQSQNLEDARAKLAEMIRAALVPPKKRRPTRRTGGSERRRLADKKMRSEKKKARSQRFDGA